MPNTGGWQEWTTVTVEGISLSAGEQTMRIYADNAHYFNINYLNIIQRQGTQSPYPGPSAQAIPGRVEAEHFDRGGEGFGYHEEDSRLKPGVNFRADENHTVWVSNCSEGGHNIGSFTAGEWQAYTIDVASTEVYDISIRVAAVEPSKKLHIEVDGMDVSGQIDVPNTGGWQVWETVTVPDITLNAGEQELRIICDEGYFNVNYFTISLFDGIKINFQRADSAIPQGYIADKGLIYQSQNGFAYGWNIDHTHLARDREKNPDQLKDTLCHFEKDGLWEIELPNGEYDITLSLGDPSFRSTYMLNVEGIAFIENVALQKDEYKVIRKAVNVTDGKLTLDQSNEPRKATRINYIEIR